MAITPAALTKPSPPASLPLVRENKTILARLSELSAQVGITDAEAIRQILAAFLANPQPIQDEPGALPLDGYLAPVRLDALLLDRIHAHATREGVGVGAVVRQAVRVHLGRT